jgi:hypothetical protein
MRWLCPPALLCAIACASPSPCSGDTCLSVAGVYQEANISRTVDCGDGNHMIFSQFHAPVSVAQNGSALHISGTNSMAGVLHDDGSASLGPVPATFLPVDGEGNPDPNGAPSPGQMYLAGIFDSQAHGFEGTYLFVADDDGCEITSRVSWKR